MSTDQRDGLDLTFRDIAPTLVEMLGDRVALIEDWQQQPAEVRADEAAQAQFQADLAFRNEAVAAFLKAEVRKADGCAAVLLWFEARIAAQKAEEERVYALRKSTEAERDFLEGCVIEALQAADKRVATGLRHTLKLKRNPPAVAVKQPELVPKEFRKVTITLPESDWYRIQDALKGTGLQIPSGKVEPKPSAIAAALKARIACDLCGGTGLQSIPESSGDKCPRCDGNKTVAAAVPGCRMEQNERLVIE